MTGKTLGKISGNHIETCCTYTGSTSEIPGATLILVTERTPNTDLYDELVELKEANKESDHWHIELIGDALAPGLIADAVFNSHLAAENFQADPVVVEQALFRREIPSLVHE